MFTLPRVQVFANVPTVYTDPASAVTSTSATLNGRVDPSNDNTLYYFFYGTSETNVSRTPLTEVMANSGLTPVQASVSNLQPGTKYYFQLVAYNSYGTTKGSWLTFTTSPGLPTVSTQPATNIAITSATLNGTVNPGGDNTWYHFYYGQQESGGGSTSTQEVLGSSGLTSVSQSISGLLPGTLYYFQIVANNSYGQVQGAFQQFTTANMTIDFSPRSFDFRNVNICSSVTQTLYIVTMSNNSSDFNATMSAGTVADFTFECTGPHVQGCSLDVQPGQNTEIATVTFHPTSTGTQGTYFQITPNVACWYQGQVYNSANPIRISVTGTGQSPANVNLSYTPQTPFSFDNTAISLTSIETLTVEKPTTLDCDIDGVVHTTNLSPSFSIAEGNPSFTLTNASKDATLTLRFSPASAGTLGGSFQIEYNAPASPSNIDTYTLTGTGVLPLKDGDYVIPDEFDTPTTGVYLLRSSGSEMTERERVPSSLTSDLSFVSPTGATIVNGSMYVADQGGIASAGAIYKINIQSDAYTKLPINVSGNFSPHDVEWISGQLYVLRQQTSLGGINSLIIADTSGTNPPLEVPLPSNIICGTPTRLVDIGDTLYLSTYLPTGSTNRPCIYFFRRSSLADKLTSLGEIDSIRYYHDPGRILTVSKGNRDTLYVWDYAQTSGIDSLFIYWHNQLCGKVAVAATDAAPYVEYAGGGSFYLLETGNLYQFNESEFGNQSIQIGRSILPASQRPIGGAFMARTTLAVQSGTIGPGATTTYTIGGREVASIQWGRSGNTPQSVVLSYYDRTYPPGSLTGHYADAYWTINPTGGTGYTYDLTLYYDSSTLNNITDEDSIIVAESNGDGKWVPEFASSVNVFNKMVTLTGLSGSSVLTVTATDREEPLPATLVKLAATQTGKSTVTLNWATGSEVNVVGFKIVKKTESDSSYQLIASYLTDSSLVAAGTVTSGKSYDYIDSKVLVGVTYDYEVIETSKDGTEKLSGPLRVTVTDKPKKFILNQNYPNPFNPSTTISYQLPVSCHVVLNVYNNLGERVETLVDEGQALGNHSVVFNGSRLASGVYYYRFGAGNFAGVKKMVLVK